MYWRDYDLSYQADDVTWAGMRVSSDSPQPSIIDDILYTAVSTLEFVNVTALGSVYIESSTKTSANIYPGFTDLLTTDLYSDDLLLPSIDTFNQFVSILSADTIHPIVLDSSTIHILYETILKHFTDTGWDTTTIYLKESDGSWSSKPIYMKQIDKSWM